MIVAHHNVKDAPKFYGGALAAWQYKGQEMMLSGPYDTGKTFLTLTKLHALCVKYPNIQTFMARKEYKALKNTAIVTFENKILPIHPDKPDCPVSKYGGKSPEYYFYPNGSSILCAGLDNPQKLLSGEFDAGCFNQAEEVSLDAWEIMATRTSGRSGNMPYTQLMGDCNPGPPQHWILNRKSLKVFEQLHRDNPSIYDPETGELTESGKQRMDVLKGLTGIRYKRGYLGLWVAVEGVVYEYNSSIHKIAREKVPTIKQWFLAVDFGYTNPFVCQLWGLDGDGRLYLWHEIYMTKRTVNAHVPKIKAMLEGKKLQAIVADHDAEDRATLHEHGLQTIAAKKDISVGIQAVEERLKIQGDGKPRLYVVEGACVDYDRELYREYPGDLHPCSTEHEFPMYAWPESKDGKADKEVPIDLNNHGMDAMRYMVMYLEKPNKSVAHSRTRTTAYARRNPNTQRRGR